MSSTRTTIKISPSGLWLRFKTPRTNRAKLIRVLLGPLQSVWGRGWWGCLPTCLELHKQQLKRYKLHVQTHPSRRHSRRESSMSYAHFSGIFYFFSIFSDPLCSTLLCFAFLFMLLVYFLQLFPIIAGRNFKSTLIAILRSSTPRASSSRQPPASPAQRSVALKSWLEK